MLSPPSHTQASGSEGGRGLHGGDAPRKGFKQGQTSSRRQADRARASILKEPVHVCRLIEWSDSAQREAHYGLRDASFHEGNSSDFHTPTASRSAGPGTQGVLPGRAPSPPTPTLAVTTPIAPCTCVHLCAPVGTERRHDPAPRGLGQSRRRPLSAPSVPEASGISP